MFFMRGKSNKTSSIFILFAKVMELNNKKKCPIHSDRWDLFSRNRHTCCSLTTWNVKSAEFPLYLISQSINLFYKSYCWTPIMYLEPFGIFQITLRLTTTVSNGSTCSFLSNVNVSLNVFQVVLLAAPQFPIIITDRLKFIISYSWTIFLTKQSDSWWLFFDKHRCIALVKMSFFEFSGVTSGNTLFAMSMNTGKSSFVKWAKLVL